MTWTDDRIARLTELYESGMPIRAIAREMGITPNAVAGKTHRLGLTGGREPAFKPAKPAPIVKGGRYAKPPKATEHQVPQGSGPGVNRCVYPLWGDDDRPNGKYCDEPTAGPRRLYCDRHHAEMFRPAPRD